MLSLSSARSRAYLVTPAASFSTLLNPICRAGLGYSHIPHSQEGREVVPIIEMQKTEA